MTRPQVGAEFYDNLYRTKESYSLNVSAQQSPHGVLYNNIVVYLRNIPNARILDVGCGTGQLAELIISSGYNYIKGIDISSVAIELSRKRCPKYEDRFQCVSIEDYDHSDDYNTAIICEVLEHIAEDIAVIDSLKPGTQVVLTVPNYDSASHVRHFDGLLSVIRRYNRLLVHYGTVIHCGDTSEFYLIHGTKQ